MRKITLDGENYTGRGQETVLATLLRHGVDARFSCGKGICHTCLLKQTNGNPPEASQKGLSEDLKLKNYFLPCICTPEGNMEVSIPDSTDVFQKARVVEKNAIGKNVYQLLLELDSQFDYHPGQYVNIKSEKSELTRSYSLASAPLIDVHLELHIKQIEQGVFSNWVANDLKVNDTIEVQSAQGGCYYNIKDKTKKILLIGTGTGLAPLYGIIKDALMIHSHEGDIYLYHGSREPEGLYFKKELKGMEREYPNFHYLPCISGEDLPLGYTAGRANDAAFKKHSDLTDYEVFICGMPDMVNGTKKQALEIGASENSIHVDAFEFSKIKGTDASYEGEEYYAHREENFKFPEPNPEMWAALKNGNLLTEILTDFYNKVYDDPILNSYFAKVSKDRVIQKQYSFMFQVLTGENVYLGDKPRNAHHWMVITDEIFDHRERLIEDSMRKFNLPEKFIKTWLDLDESYRKLMVKSKPWDKIQDGIVIPVDGFDEVVIDTPGLCDHCQAEVLPGDKVRYHLHEAKIYCPKCTEQTELVEP